MSSHNGNFSHGQSAPPLDKNKIYQTGMSPNGADQANIKGNGLNGFSPVDKPVVSATPTPSNGAALVPPVDHSPNNDAPRKS